MQKLQVSINKLRPVKKATGVEQYFIDAARDHLTKPQFNLLMGRAVKLLEAADASSGG